MPTMIRRSERRLGTAAQPQMADLPGDTGASQGAAEGQAVLVFRPLPVPLSGAYHMLF